MAPGSFYGSYRYRVAVGPFTHWHYGPCDPPGPARTRRRHRAYAGLYAGYHPTLSLNETSYRLVESFDATTKEKYRVLVAPAPARPRSRWTVAHEQTDRPRPPRQSAYDAPLGALHTSQLSLRERTKFGFALAASPGPIIAL